MGEVKRVAPGCDNPLVELCGRRRTAGTSEQHPTCLLFFIKRAGHGEEFWPGSRWLEAVLRKLLSIVVGDLHIRPEGQEIPPQRGQSPCARPGASPSGVAPAFPVVRR